MELVFATMDISGLIAPENVQRIVPAMACVGERSVSAMTGTTDWLVRICARITAVVVVSVERTNKAADSANVRLGLKEMIAPSLFLVPMNALDMEHVITVNVHVRMDGEHISITVFNRCVRPAEMETIARRNYVHPIVRLEGLAIVMERVLASGVTAPMIVPSRIVSTNAAIKEYVSSQQVPASASRDSLVPIAPRMNVPTSAVSMEHAILAAVTVMTASGVSIVHLSNVLVIATVTGRATTWLGRVHAFRHISEQLVHRCFRLWKSSRHPKKYMNQNRSLKSILSPTMSMGESCLDLSAPTRKTGSLRIRTPSL